VNPFFFGFFQQKKRHNFGRAVLQLTPWGNASDSRPEDWGFDSLWGQTFLVLEKKLKILNLVFDALSHAIEPKFTKISEDGVRTLGGSWTKTCARIDPKTVFLGDEPEKPQTATRAGSHTH
jgi:hypothetical protein